jgi:c-ets proto-oncogene protein
VPPLTPGTNKKVGEALKLTYATWASHAKHHDIPNNPRDWSEIHVQEWLRWTMEEFNFGSATFEELLVKIKVRKINYT